MKHWQQYSLQERIQILDITSGNTGLPRIAVEKDWWVTMVLKALSMTQYSNLMSFKGGTSLSKGWQLINRFSEDIDIALKREDRFAISGTSNTQLTKARRIARHYIVRELPTELQGALESLGVTGFSIEPETYIIKDGINHELRADTHPSVIYVSYNSVLPETSDYVQPRVKIEISCLSMDEPVENLTLNSFLSTSVSDVEDLSVNFNTVIPTRTFLEKMFLLHEEFNKEKPRSYRMSRHLYDLEKMMDTIYGKDAIANKELYAEVVLHRSIYNKIPYIDYESHHPSQINFLPPESIIQEWENDYKSLKEQFIYDTKSISFEELVLRISELQKRVRNILKTSKNSQD